VLIFFKLKRNNGELDFPDKAVIYCARDGKNKFFFKAQIDNVIMSEEYLKNPTHTEGYDLAICIINEDKLRCREVSQTKTLKRRIANVAPPFPDKYDVDMDDEILVIGYPDEYKHQMYYMVGTVSEVFFFKTDSNGELVKYKDIDTTEGQSGCPVFRKLEDDLLELIAIHVGPDHGEEANCATYINEEKYNWIVDRLKDHKGMIMFGKATGKVHEEEKTKSRAEPAKPVSR
jgi:V8-like Glu-specific endopeptidase